MTVWMIEKKAFALKLVNELYRGSNVRFGPKLATGAI